MKRSPLELGEVLEEYGDERRYVLGSINRVILIITHISIYIGIHLRAISK